jgi:purine-binding chemotaxis protein CheW
MNQLTQSTSSAAGTAAEEAQTHQYLTFMLGGELFAIGILCIKEIIEYTCLTEVPMMPAAVRGVINLRGAVVPVTDLLIRFGKRSSPVSKRTCIVIIEVTALGEHQDIGIVVDSVDSVLDIPAIEIVPPPTFGAGIRTDFIRGMGKVNGQFVILLDVNHVLAVGEVAALAHVPLSGTEQAA